MATRPSPVDSHFTGQKAFSDRVFQACLGVACALLAYAAFTSTANGFRIASTPYQIDYEEGNVLNAAARIHAGLTPYPPASSWPVVINCYGPIPYAVTAAVLRFGPPEFFRPRAVTLLAAMTIAVEIGLLVLHFTGSRLLAGNFGLLFLTLRLVQEWSPLLRVDFLGLAFSLGGLVVFFCLPRWRLAPGTFFALSLLCKVTFLAAPLAWAVVLVRRKQWRLLAQGLAAGMAVLVPTAVTLQWVTHGAFLFHQFGTHADALSWTNYGDNALSVLHQILVPLALTLMAVWRSRKWSAPLIYLLSAALGTVTALKLGSNSNHFLEFEAAMCISAAAGIYELRKTAPLPLLNDGFIAVCLVLLVGQGLADRALYSTKGIVDQCAQAYAYIGSHNDVLSENIGALVLTGKPVLLSNPFVYAQLVRHGKWHDQRVEQMLQQKVAGLVVIGKPGIIDQRWSQPALDALAANYRVTRRFACSDAVLTYEPIAPQ